MIGVAWHRAQKLALQERLATAQEPGYLATNALYIAGKLLNLFQIRKMGMGVVRLAICKYAHHTSSIAPHQEWARFKYVC